LDTVETAYLFVAFDFNSFCLLGTFRRKSRQPIPSGFCRSLLSSESLLPYFLPFFSFCLLSDESLCYFLPFLGGVFRQKTPFFMQLKVIMREIFFLIIVLYICLCF